MSKPLIRLLILIIFISCTLGAYLVLINDQGTRNKYISGSPNQINYRQDILDLEEQMMDPSIDKEFVFKQLYELNLLRDDFVGARNLVERAVALVPDSLYFRELYADYLLKENKQNEALEQYRYAQSLAPDDIDSYLGELEIFTLQKRYIEVGELASRYLLIMPNSKELNFAHTLISLETKRKDEIIALRDGFTTDDMEYAVLSDLIDYKDDKGAVVITNAVYKLMGSRYEAFALPLIKQAKAINKFIDNLYIYQGVIYKNVGDYEQAIKEFKRASRINEVQLDSQINLILVYLAQADDQSLENALDVLNKSDQELTSEQLKILVENLRNYSRYNEILIINQLGESELELNTKLIFAEAYYIQGDLIGLSNYLDQFGSEKYSLTQREIVESLKLLAKKTEFAQDNLPVYNSSLANLILGNVLLDRGQKNEARIVLERSLDNSVRYDAYVQQLLNTI